VLYGVQSGKINTKKTLNELFVRLQKLGSTTSQQGWERARDSFLKKIAAPLARRNAEELLNQKLTVLDTYPEKLTDEQIRKMGIKLTRKFRFVLRNDTGRRIRLKRAVWHAESDDAPADPNPWWGFQHPIDSQWSRDFKTLDVGHSKLRVGIALHNRLSHAEIDQQRANQKLGVLEIKVAMSGRTLTYRRRF
jgi:hypothetical protein